MRVAHVRNRQRAAVVTQPEWRVLIGRRLDFEFMPDGCGQAGLALQPRAGEIAPDHEIIIDGEVREAEACCGLPNVFLRQSQSLAPRRQLGFRVTAHAVQLGGEKDAPAAAHDLDEILVRCGVARFTEDDVKHDGFHAGLREPLHEARVQSAVPRFAQLLVFGLIGFVVEVNDDHR